LIWLVNLPIGKPAVCLAGGCIRESQWSSRNDEDTAKSFCRKFPEFMPNQSPWDPSWNVKSNIVDLWFYRDELRTIWSDPAPVVRQISLAFLHGEIVEMFRRNFDPDAEARKISHREDVPTPFTYTYGWLLNLAMVFQHAQSVSEKMRLCANPECHGPYFIAEKNNQKCCGLNSCVEASQRARKTKWWWKCGGGNDQRRAARARRSL
jgi:hypothetical protein